MRFFATALIVLILMSSSVLAVGPKFGIGASFGLDIPLAQDDQDQGTIFGFRGKLSLIPMISAEAFLGFTKYGDPKLDGDDYVGVTADLEGSKITSYGVNGILGSFGGPGFKPYGIVGLGFYNIKRDQTQQDDTDFGFSGGLGFELGFNAPVSVDVRGLLVVVPVEGASKKSATIMGGLNYYIGM
jgi:opacity protein-like surface antigen